MWIQSHVSSPWCSWLCDLNQCLFTLMFLIVWFKPVFVCPDVPKFGYKIVFLGFEATLWGCRQVKIWELIIFDFIAALNVGVFSISGTWSDSGCKQRTTDRCASAWSPCLRLVTAAQVGTRTKFCFFTRMENYYYYSLLYSAVLCSRADSLRSFCMWSGWVTASFYSAYF